MGKLFAASNDLVSYFDTRFPLMKNESWHEWKVPSNLLSWVTACMRGKLLPMASLLRQTKTSINNGSIGNDMLPQHKSTPSLIPPYPPPWTWHCRRSICWSGQDMEIRKRKSDQSFRSLRCPRVHLQYHWAGWKTQSTLLSWKQLPIPPWESSWRFLMSRPTQNTSVGGACISPKEYLHEN